MAADEDKVSEIPESIDDALTDEVGADDEIDSLSESVDLPKELTEAEEVAASVAGARPARKATPKKGAPTSKRKGAKKAQENERTTPVEFVNESVEELKKVVWPTTAMWRQYFIVVLVFVVFIIAFVSVLDLLAGMGLLWWLGGN